MTKKRETGPQFVRYFGPILDALRTLGGSGSPREVVQQIAQDLNVSEEAQNELLSSGQSRFQNQVAWARYYLVQEGLLESSERGVWSLSEQGLRTHLSFDQAREISRRGDKAYQKKRWEKDEARPDSAEPSPELLPVWWTAS